MEIDYNFEIALYLGKILSKLTRSSKIIEYIEQNFPFTESTYKKTIKLIDRELKGYLYSYEKEYEKLIVDEFLNLIKSIIPNQEVDEIVYKISKEFSKDFEKGDIENFLKKLKRFQKEFKKLFHTGKEDKKKFLSTLLKTHEEKSLDTESRQKIIALLNREEELENSKKELIETINIFIDNLTSFFETDDLLNQKIKKLKEEIKHLETFDSIKRFKSEVKDLFLKLGVIERVLEEEKKELKNIILLLAENLKEFIGNSDSYAKSLDEFIIKIQQTDDIGEIKKLKMRIMKTTLMIKDKTLQIKEKLSKADMMLKQAKEKMKKLEREMAIAKEKALYDGLTGIYNRAVFNDRIVKEIERAKREKRNLSFIMLDIDNFKKINDNYGHQTGDMVLKILTSQIKKIIRDFDFFARYGGEEFALILPDTDIKTAKEIAERIRKKIEHTKIIFKGERIPVTISIGCTELKDNDTEKTLIERADSALYEAKKSGRNKVILK